MGLLDELDELRRRHELGELTEAEFEAARRELLSAPPARGSRSTASPEPAPDPLRWAAPAGSAAMPASASAPMAAPAAAPVTTPAPPAAAGPTPPAAPAGALPPPAGPPVTHLPYAPRGLHVLGRWAQGLLATTGGLFALSAVLGLNAWRVFTDFADGIASASTLASSDSAYWSVVLFGFLGMLATSIVLIVWMYRYWEQLRVTQHGREPRRGRGWTIGGWFVPVVSLWIPKQLMDDFWRLSAGPAGDTWGARRVPAKLHWWWATFLTGNVVQQVSGAMEPGEDLDAWHRFYATSLAGDVLWTISALLAAWIVGSLVVRLSELTGYRR